MTDHPIETTYVDGVAVAKSGVRSYERDYNRIRVPNLAWVQSRDLSDLFGFDYAGTIYERDTTDTTSADNGTTVIVDSVGTRFKQIGMASDIASKLFMRANCGGF